MCCGSQCWGGGEGVFIHTYPQYTHLLLCLSPSIPAPWYTHPLVYQPPSTRAPAPSGITTPWDLGLGTSHTYSTPGRDLGPGISNPCPWKGPGSKHIHPRTPRRNLGPGIHTPPRTQNANTSEHITFPQFRWRSVINKS